MLSRTDTLSFEDVANLTESEKKLISRQGILQETFAQLYGEYAQKELGIRADYDTETRIEIDFTDEAKQLLRANKVNTRRTRNTNVERLAG